MHNNIYIIIIKTENTTATMIIIECVCVCGDNAITRVHEYARACARSVITRCQTMAYHKAVAIINNVGGPRAAAEANAIRARAHARYETSGRPRYGGRVWRGGRLLSSGRTRAVSRGWP